MIALILAVYGIYIRMQVYRGRLLELGIFWIAGELLLGMACIFSKKSKILASAVYVGHFFEVAVYVFLAVIVFLYVGLFLKCRENIPDSIKKEDAIVVLGTKLRDGEMTWMLKDRLDFAVDYLNKYEGEFPEMRIIVSGGRGRNPEKKGVTEAERMREYLVANGIPDECIVEEPESCSTYENIKYSVKMCGDGRKVFLSSSYHLPRVKVILEDTNVSDYMLLGAKTKLSIMPYKVLEESLGIMAWKMGVY